MVNKKTVVTAEEAEEDSPLIWVIPGAKAEAGKVIISERDPRHPGGIPNGEEPEIFISTETKVPVQVFVTSLVDDRIRAGYLQEVDGSDSKVPSRRYTPAQTPIVDSDEEDEADTKDS